MSIPNQVTLTEVGPRDGLQNEPMSISTDVKLTLIDKLANAGLTTIETTAFVSPKWVPQMADHSDLCQRIVKKPGVTYPVLVPNLQGYEDAVAAGATDIAVFTAASNTFSQKNTHCSIEESLARIALIMKRANAENISVRGYISCVLGCPYEGDIHPTQVTPIATQLISLGCREISLGDTIGIGSAGTAITLIKAVTQSIDKDKIAMHFHDTYGQALANIYASLTQGIHKFDSSVAGLGGCPYAPGAAGNVATEDVLYMLAGLGIDTGINLADVVAAGRYITEIINKPLGSKVAYAMTYSRH